MAIHPYELLTEDENNVISKTRQLRMEIIDKYLEEKGIPTNTRDIRVLNEVMNSLDSQVLGLVDRRLKKEENDTTNDIKDMVKEVLDKVTDEMFMKIDVVNKNRKIELSDDYIPTDIVPGETELEYKKIDPSEVLGEDLS